MILHISAAKLAEAATAVAHAVRTGHTNHEGKFPVLSCCRLAANGHLSIYGTDLDTGIAAVADCDIVEPGVAVVDGNKLADIARKLIRSDVQLESGAGCLVIKSGRSRFSLTMQSDEDFPIPLVVDNGFGPLELTGADVKAIFGGAAAGASVNDSRIYLSGVHLFSEPTDVGHRLCGVGADDVVLSHVATSVSCPDLGRGVLVHRDTCKLAVQMFRDTGAALKLGNRLVEFSSDSRRLVAKMIDATPSAWRTVVPLVDVPNYAVVLTAEFRAAIEYCLAVAVSSDSDHTAVMKAPAVALNWGEERSVTVALGNVEKQAPSAFDAIAADDVNGAADFFINARKLHRLLEGISAETLRISLHDAQSVVRIDAGADRFVSIGQMRF
jgi:DNA polymerase III sliding clamp (beta) subunit (PCNA family)